MRPVLLPAELAPDLPAVGSVLHHCHGQSMGTTWRVSLGHPPGLNLAALQSAIEKQLAMVVEQMSHWLPSSNLMRFNTAPAGSWQRLPESFFSVLSYGLEIAKASAGAYNPCAGALVNAWGFGAEKRYDQLGFFMPSASCIASAMQDCAWQHLQLDTANSSALQIGRMALDFSSIAKGFAVDQIAEYLQAQGFAHFLLELGGELRGAGMKPDAQPWWVELEQVPNATPNQAPPLLALHGLAVATSGDYRRFFTHAGQRYAHTLDPRTGYPLENKIACVNVIHPQCMAADALSTALYVLGIEAGLHFAEQHKIAARFVLREASQCIEFTSRPYQALLQ